MQGLRFFVTCRNRIDPDLPVFQGVAGLPFASTATNEMTLTSAPCHLAILLHNSGDNLRERFSFHSGSDLLHFDNRAFPLPCAECDKLLKLNSLQGMASNHCMKRFTTLVEPVA